MFLSLGNETVVRKKDVIAVFDLDNTTQSKITRDYLAGAEKSGRVVSAAGEELPKSFVVCCGGSGPRTARQAQTVYLSQMNSSTLLRRCESLGIE